jgi:hypothetical protein
MGAADAPIGTSTGHHLDRSGRELSLSAEEVQ